MRVLRGLFGCLENISCSDQNEVFVWCDSVIWVFFVVLKGKGEKGSAIEPRWWVRMGRLFVVTLDGGRVYSCKHCKTHFAYANQIISKVSPNATTLSYFSEIQKEQEKAYLVLLPLYFFLVHYVDLDISILFLEDYSSYRTFFFVQKSVN